MNKAVVDTISEDMVTLLVGEEEQVVIVDISSLPAGAREGGWLTRRNNGTFVLDKEETKKRRKRVKGKLDMLREQTKG